VDRYLGATCASPQPRKAVSLLGSTRIDAIESIVRTSRCMTLEALQIQQHRKPEEGRLRLRNLGLGPGPRMRASPRR
jgi:hypothetical protein